MEYALEQMQNAKKLLLQISKEEGVYFKGLPKYNTDEGRESLNSLSALQAVDGFLHEAIEDLYIGIDGWDEDLEWFTYDGKKNGEWPIDM